MKIGSTTLPDQITDYALRWVQSREDFSSAELRSAMGPKFPKYEALMDKAMTRLIQKLKTSGDIEKAPQRRWRWCGR